MELSDVEVLIGLWTVTAGPLAAAVYQLRSSVSAMSARFDEFTEANQRDHQLLRDSLAEVKADLKEDINKIVDTPQPKPRPKSRSTKKETQP